MTSLGTVHVLLDDTEHVYPGVPVSDDGVTLAIRGGEAGPVTGVTGATDWWWRVAPAQLPEWARGAAEEFAGRVRV